VRLPGWPFGLEVIEKTLAVGSLKRQRECITPKIDKNSIGKRRTQYSDPGRRGGKKKAGGSPRGHASVRESRNGRSTVPMSAPDRKKKERLRAEKGS